MAALCAAKVRHVGLSAAKCDCPGNKLVFDGVFGSGKADLER